MTKQQLIRAITAMIWRTAGRHYRIELDVLDVQSLRELHRLLRDLEDESQLRASRARRELWRKP